MPIPAIFRAAVLPPDDLIIGDYAFKVNTSTEYIYLILCPSGHGRRPRRTPPDTGGKSPETAGMTGSPGQPPALISHKPAHRHAAAARPPRGCAVGAARRRAGTARLRVAAPYCELPGAMRPVTGDTAPHGQRPAELHNPRITQMASYPASNCTELSKRYPQIVHRQEVNFIHILPIL